MTPGPDAGARPPAWIDTVAPGAAEGRLEEVFRTILARSGSVANILRSQSLHPEALRDHYALYRTLMYGPGRLSRAEREAVAVVVSSVNGCHY